MFCLCTQLYSYSYVLVATRTVVLHGVAEETPLEQVRQHFIDAAVADTKPPELLARVHDKNADYKW